MEESKADWDCKSVASSCQSSIEGFPTRSISLKHSYRRKYRYKKTIRMYSIVALLVLAFLYYHFQWNDEVEVKDVQKTNNIEESNEITKIYREKYCKNGCNEDDQQIIYQMLEMLKEEAQIKQLPSKKNDSVQKVKMVKRKTQFKQFLSDNFEKCYLQKLQLEIMKHPKLTSYKKRSIGLLQNIMDLFDNHPYYNIEKLVDESEDDFQWHSSGQFLTVKSKEPIVPFMMVFYLPEKSESEEIKVFGLAIGFDMKLQGIQINQYQLQPGKNVIRCEGYECKSEYDMLLINMAGLRMKGVEVYRQEVIM